MPKINLDSLIESLILHTAYDIGGERHSIIFKKEDEDDVVRELTEQFEVHLKSCIEEDNMPKTFDTSDLSVIQSSASELQSILDDMFFGKKEMNTENIRNLFCCAEDLLNSCENLYNKTYDDE